MGLGKTLQVCNNKFFILRLYIESIIIGISMYNCFSYNQLIPNMFYLKKSTLIVMTKKYYEDVNHLISLFVSYKHITWHIYIEPDQ